MTRNDGTGQPLDGSKHNYTLTFAAGQFPPVNAFWSVTMYDGKTQLLIKNPINRYLVNSPMLPGLKKNKDGRSRSISRRIRRARTRNRIGCLPPTARFIWSCDSTGRRRKPPSILPPGEGTWNPPPVVQAK